MWQKWWQSTMLAIAVLLYFCVHIFNGIMNMLIGKLLNEKIFIPGWPALLIAPFDETTKMLVHILNWRLFVCMRLCNVRELCWCLNNSLSGVLHATASGKRNQQVICSQNPWNPLTAISWAVVLQHFEGVLKKDCSFVSFCCRSAAPIRLLIVRPGSKRTWEVTWTKHKTLESTAKT